MAENTGGLATIYKGWDDYQQLLSKAIAPLSLEQLALRAVSNLRSIGEIATHMVGARARWLNTVMGIGGDEVAAIGSWDRKDSPTRTAPKLVEGFEITWRVLQDALNRWTPADMEYVFEGTWQGEEYSFSRQWVIWHLIEHDLHHGGELSFSLGMHGLAAPDL